MNNPPVPSLDDLTRRTVSAWWQDGLWDFAMAGFFLLTALWSYPLIRALAFPTWTWVFPFVTDEVINPLQARITGWMLLIMPLWALYLFLTYQLVRWLKRRFIAPILGDVRHSFFLKVEKKVYLVHIGAYMLLLALVVGLCMIFKDGAHYYSAIFITAPVGILWMIGYLYRLPRYCWVSGISLVICLILELFFTTNADYMAGPQTFFEVSPFHGNPAIPLIVWTVTCTISGIIGLVETLRQRHDPAE